MKSYRQELEDLQSADLYRQLRLVSGGQGRQVLLAGRQCTLFCSNNYLGLADHPLLKEAAVRAVEKAGTGSGASRLVSGNMELHEELEQRIASFKGTEAALLFNSGYAANTGVIPALFGRDDVIFSDRLNHASIVDGALLSRARLIRYPHNDIQALRRLLSSTETRGRRLIVTDGIFSMDGDIAPLEQLVALKEDFNAMLMVDDAHGTGVLGAAGRGSAELTGTMAAIDIHMGTLGKALGSFGAYVAASREIIDYLINKARSFVFSTSLPPAVVAASLAAFDLVESQEGSRLRTRLRENADYFRKALHSAGLDTMDSVTQIVPIKIGDAADVMAYSSALLEMGVFVQGIRPPTVPAGSSRLRFTLMATHTLEDITQAVAAVLAVRERQRSRSSAYS